MANAAKNRGNKYERDVEQLCRAAGFPDAKRTRAGRREDEGDIHLDRGSRYILQTKDVVTPQWRPWLDELAEQVAAAKAEHGALVVKRRGTGGRPALHLAVLPLDAYLALLAQLDRGGLRG